MNASGYDEGEDMQETKSGSKFRRSWRYDAE